MQFPFLFSELDNIDAMVLAIARAAPEGHHDELIGPGGKLRGVWGQFFASLGIKSLAALNAAQQQIQKRIEEDGVTYNVYGDQTSMPRRWSLDLLPFLISAVDWRDIEPALRQRARLLSALMGDIYGKQQLLSEGLLPPALVLGSPGYQRSMHGVAPLGGSHLQIIGFDLARGPDNKWWVVGQRTQAPSGLGYALENRIIIGRTFPHAFATMQVQRLAASYNQFLQSLIKAAPFDPITDTGAPRVVLLTPGRFNETYFEQSYLANYLGIPLVEGSDLTVRSDRLYLKTLYGLERVHVVIRRIDDSFCDPLELNPASALGVPGLLQAVRAGQVLVANSIGSAVLESPALQGFLPAISRRVLGEELLLPPRDSWWCGETIAKEQAFAHLHEVRVRATYRGIRPLPKGAEGEGLVDIDAVKPWIEANPEAYTIQSYLPYSKTPCWSGRGLAPHSAVVRFYAVHLGDGQWHIMPGGLTRIAEKQDEVSMQRGGSSADTWVMTGEAPDSFSLLAVRAEMPTQLMRRRVVSSRVAENLFWMGRYTERLENGIRLAQAILQVEAESLQSEQAVSQALQQAALGIGLLKAELDPDCVDPVPLHTTPLQRAVIEQMADPDARSLLFDMNGLIHCSNQIRDRLSLEHWQQISQGQEYFSRSFAQNMGVSVDHILRTLQTISTNLSVVTAAQTDGMTRDDGWRLLMLGRQIERLQNMSLFLQTFFSSGAVWRDTGFQWVLDIFRSTLTYRSRYQGQRHASLLLDLLVHDPENPRSLACTMSVIRQEVTSLQDATGYDFHLQEDVIGAMSLREFLSPENPDSAGTVALTLRCQRAATALSDRLEARFFSHTQDVNRQVLSS